MGFVNFLHVKQVTIVWDLFQWKSDQIKIPSLVFLGGVGIKFMAFWYFEVVVAHLS